MKIDFVEISKISNIKSLKKYKLDKPIFFNNYLFHYLIITDNLKALKLTDFPIYKENEDGMNGFHLAALHEKYKILNYLIKKYPKSIYNKSQEGLIFLYYLKFDKSKFIDIIIKNKLNLDNIFYDFILYNDDNINLLGQVFKVSKFKIIKKIIAEFKLDFNKIFSENPVFFYILSNNNLELEQKKELINMLNKIVNIYNYYDDGYDICWYTLSLRDLKLIKHFNKCNYNSSLPLNAYSFFRTSYQTDINDNNFEISNYIWKKLKNNFSYHGLNKFGETIAHFLLKLMSTGVGNEKLVLDILKGYDFWTAKDIEKNTPVHYIVLCDFNKYHNLLKKKDVDITIKNKDNLTCLDFASNKWKKFLKKLPKFKCKNDNLDCFNNVKIFKNKYSHGNIFQSRFIDMAIFLLYLTRKYNQLYLPKMIKNQMDNITWDQGLIYPDSYLENNLNFPWIIIWNSHNSFWIHPYLNNLINSLRRSKSHEFCAVMLSLRLPDGGLHANIIIYDFNKNTIERFDPYGDTLKLDVKMDSILEEELTWDTGFSYLNPGVYMTTAGFQTISNETNMENLKLGDFGGYCLAWCLWYLEHRINNADIDQKKLFDKTIKKLLNQEVYFSEFIRNYANSINKERIKILKKIGIPEKKISNEYLEINFEEKIYDYIEENM